MSLRKQVLAYLREMVERDGPQTCMGIDSLAEHFTCDRKELFDPDHDTGVLFHLDREGSIGFTADQSCVYAQGGRMVWDE